MKTESLLELEKIIEKHSDEILNLLDESPLGNILDAIHKKFYDDANEAIQTALRIERNYTNHINNKKGKKHAHSRKSDVF